MNVLLIATISELSYFQNNSLPLENYYYGQIGDPPDACRYEMDILSTEYLHVEW